MNESAEQIEAFAREMRFQARNGESIEAFENRVRKKSQEWLIHRVMEYGMFIRQNEVMHYRPYHEGAGGPVQEPVTEAELFYSAKEPDEQTQTLDQETL